MPHLFGNVLDVDNTVDMGVRMGYNISHNSCIHPMKKIDAKKKYSLGEVHRQGLLVNMKTRKPMTSINQIRTVLKLAGLKAYTDKKTGYTRYLISGKDLIALNKERVK